MCLVCPWLRSKILSEPPQLPFGWAFILPLCIKEVEAPKDFSECGQPVWLGFEPRPSATHPALLLIFTSHLRQPLFLKKEFSTGGIEVTKLERTKKQSCHSSQGPSFDLSHSKDPSFCCHPSSQIRQECGI